MKVVNSLLALVVVFVGLVSPVFADADESTDSLFCTAFGWVVRPLGFCQTTVRVEVVTSDAEVLDVAGKLFFKSNENSKNVEINLEGLPKGTYLLNLKTESGSSVHKILKMESR